MIHGFRRVDSVKLTKCSLEQIPGSLKRQSYKIILEFAGHNFEVYTYYLISTISFTEHRRVVYRVCRHTKKKKKKNQVAQFSQSFCHMQCYINVN